MVAKDVVIFNNARGNQAKELEFCEHLCKQFPTAQLRQETHSLPTHLESKTLNSKEIAKKIQVNPHLSDTKKIKCLRELIQLPPEVKVVTSISDITVDFTLNIRAKKYYIEFHEAQHYKLSVSRPSNLYTVDDELMKVPRFLQRLLRDIWRFKYLPNYKIVWYDWFELNKGVDIFKSKEKEFALPGCFRISDLA
jgi:hypothetical protein